MVVVKKTCHSFLYSWRFRTLSLPFIWTELASKLQTRECKWLCLYELLFFALYICFTFTRLLEAMYQHRLGFITRIFKFHVESKIVNFWKIQTFIIYSIEFSVPLLHVYYAEHGWSPLLPKNSYLILLTMRCSIVKWRVPYSPRTKER